MSNISMREYKLIPVEERLTLEAFGISFQIVLLQKTIMDQKQNGNIYSFNHLQKGNATKAKDFGERVTLNK